MFRMQLLHVLALNSTVPSPKTGVWFGHEHFHEEATPLFFRPRMVFLNTSSNRDGDRMDVTSVFYENQQSPRKTADELIICVTDSNETTVTTHFKINNKDKTRQCCRSFELLSYSCYSVFPDEAPASVKLSHQHPKTCPEPLRTQPVAPERSTRA